MLRVIVGNRYVDTMVLQKSLCMMLYVVMFLFAWSVVIEFFINLPATIQLVKEGNTTTGIMMDGFLDEPDLTLTYAFLAMQSIVNALPNGLGAVAMFFCIRVLKELLRDAYSERAQILIKRLIRYCKISLVVVVLSGMVLNLMQIMLAHLLYQVNVQIDIPIFSILFFLVIHLMARYIEENQKWKMENELFI